jgi:hypothetical protein
MSWLSDIFIRDSNQQSGEQADHYAQQQADYNAKLEARRAEGSLPTDYTPAAGGELDSQDAAALQGAGEGAIEGALNVVDFATETIPNAVNKTLSATVGAVWKSIPWSVWLLAGVALFFWMGGATLLKGRLAKK